MKRSARAIAHPNIALAKYWGKLDAEGNFPAVPSLSVTLAGMRTETSVRFDPALREDRLLVQGEPASAPAAARMVTLLDRVRKAAGFDTRAEVVSQNDFPTASGLASSASGFAALALAAVRAAGLDWDLGAVSDLARRSSASAARSIFGGFVALPAGEKGLVMLPAEPLLPADHWDLVVVVAVATEQAKEVGSTEGMLRTARTSPLYEGWLQGAPRVYERVRQALVDRDLEALGQAVEQSALAMHGTAMGAAPPIVYFRPATIAALEAVRALRRKGTLAYATIDAGPHVKVVAEASNLDVVADAMRNVPGIERIIVTRPGPGAAIIAEEAA